MPSSNLPRLYAVVDVQVARRQGWEPRALGRAYLAGGARLLQLRAKELPSGAFLTLATALAEDSRVVGGRLIVNDRADLGVLAGAAGVHVGQDDLSPVDVRRVTGADLDVGLSTHTSEQIAAALDAPISYLAVGPVFSTGTKATGYDPVGLRLVSEAAAHARSRGLPVVAIGGITLDTAAAVIGAGAASVAVITDLLTGDPEARVRQYLSVLDDLPL
ncbi:MAG: thiamine phosphate synthase [Acidobacteriota bacterium]